MKSSHMYINQLNIMNELQLQFLRSRKVFKDARRPYDTRDLLDSFKFHYEDLSSKVKKTQTRCNLIFSLLSFLSLLNDI